MVISLMLLSKNGLLMDSRLFSLQHILKNGRFLFITFIVMSLQLKVVAVIIERVFMGYSLV
jgi:hypothetical protein